MTIREMKEMAGRIFSLYGKVDRRTYLSVGLGLGTLKYVVETSVFSYVSGRFYTPIDFVSPFFATREPFVVPSPLGLTLAWMVWTLPFLWVGVSMTVRLWAYDCRVSPWWALSILVPIVNLIAMAIFACLPSRESSRLSHCEEEQKAEPNPFEVTGDFSRPPIL